jgi:hypothetical protein
MTTAFQLIHPTIAVDARHSGESAVPSTTAAPTKRQHQSQQQRQERMIRPTLATPSDLLQQTTAAFPLALIASPNRVVATSAHDSVASVRNALRAPNHQPQRDDSILESRHQTTFAGHPFTSVVYSRRNRQSDAESVVNISHGDLLELEPNGSLYVVPAWYVIVDRDTRQLDIIEPKLLSEVTSRLKSART